MIEQFFSRDFLISFAFSIIRMATPLIYCAMGALITLHVGSLNIALEGIMLTAALTAVILNFLPQKPGGIVGAIIGGLMITSILAYMHLVKKADLFLTCLAVNLMAGGGTVLVLLALTGERGSSRLLDSLVVPAWNIPLIKDIPILGEIISGHSILTYTAFIVVLVTYYLVFRTKQDCEFVRLV